MKLELTQSVLFPAPPEPVWELLTDMNQMALFNGWGPIPGIAEAKWIEGDGKAGSIRVVSNRDGTKHREPPAMVIRIAMGRAVSRHHAELASRL